MFNKFNSKNEILSKLNKCAGNLYSLQENETRNKLRDIAKQITSKPKFKKKELIEINKNVDNLCKELDKPMPNVGTCRRIALSIGEAVTFGKATVQVYSSKADLANDKVDSLFCDISDLEKQRDSLERVLNGSRKLSKIEFLKVKSDLKVINYNIESKYADAQKYLKAGESVRTSEIIKTSAKETQTIEDINTSVDVKELQDNVVDIQETAKNVDNVNEDVGNIVGQVLTGHDDADTSYEEYLENRANATFGDNPADEDPNEVEPWGAEKNK